MNTRECFDCGLDVGVSQSDFKSPTDDQHCPKCDADLFAQSDGTLITRDIAHQRETVDRSIIKMDEVLQHVWEGTARGARLIVGGGLIRSEVLGQLQYYEDQGYIKSYMPEDPNHGAIVVYLR